MNRRRAASLGLLALIVAGLSAGLVLAPRRTLPGAGDPVSYPLGEISVETRAGLVRVVDLRPEVMGTLFGIEAWAATEAVARRACAAAYERIAGLEALHSAWRGDSFLSRLNREAGRGEVALDPDTAFLLRESRKYWTLSEGAFDPSIAPLQRLWKPQRAIPAIPTEEEIAAILPLVGFDKVLLSPAGDRVRFAREGVAIDLGAIAKGYAADEAARAARTAGAIACRVNAGGNMMFVGAPPDAPEGFPVEIRDPRRGATDVLPGRSFRLRDRGIATSGNYERYTEAGGRRFSHILDPRTGWPITDAVVQVTVIAPDGTSADALSTSLAVLGPVKGLALAESLPDVEAFFVLPDGAMAATTGFPGGGR